MALLSLFAPAKLNLFLAITDRRDDGFHNLVSVVAPLNFGDDLEIETTRSATYSLSCDNPEIPLDETNLILRAAKLFSEATGWDQRAHFHLRKRVPMGAGLGGGSSDATTALLGLNRLAGNILDVSALEKLAAQIGSDCAFFLHGSSNVMRGRGDKVVPLAPSAALRLRGRRVLVFKPSFGISTVWAYRALAQNPQHYVPTELAEARLSAWEKDPSRPVADLIFNNLETVAFPKFIALPVMLAELRKQFSLVCGMSGSGSACFALIPDSAMVSDVVAAIRQGWGSNAFVVEAQLR